MAISIKINIGDIGAIGDKLSQLSGDMAHRVSVEAIDRTMALAKAGIVSNITSEYNVDAGFVRESVFSSKAERRGGGMTVTATAFIFGNPKRIGRSLNAIRFLAGSVSNPRRGGPVLLFRFKGFGVKQKKGSFIGNKGRTVFVRATDGRTMQDGKRAALDPVQVIGISQMFSSNTVSDRVMDGIDKGLVSEFAKSIGSALGGGR